MKIIKRLHGVKGRMEGSNRESTWSGCWKNILLHTRKLNQFNLNPIDMMQVKIQDGTGTEMWN